MELRKIIKSNDKLYSLTRKVINRVPKKIIYCDKYFEVMELLKKQDKGIDIQDILNSRLSNILKNALKNVPYYRKLNLNIKPEDINKDNAKEILNMFPYLNKKDVMDNSEEFISDLYDKKDLRFGMTGFSSGQAMKIWCIEEENQIEKAFFDYKWSNAGYRSYSKVVRIACEGLRKEDENPCSYTGDKMRVSPNHLTSEKWMGEILNRIREFKPEFFHAYPSCFQYLLKYMELNNLRITGIKGIFLASENVTENMLILSELIFKSVQVIFHYGLSERSNLAWGIYEDNRISYKCEDVYGYSENFITEDGFYEIVGTSYWNNVMPLIRYRTQDIGKIENGFITNLDGRLQELLITKQGERIPGIAICIDKFTWNYADLIQVVQNEPGKIEFHIKPKDTFNSMAEEEILNSQKGKWGNMFDISIVIDNKISKTKFGKFRDIINNIISQR